MKVKFSPETWREIEKMYYLILNKHSLMEDTTEDGFFLDLSDRYIDLHVNALTYIEKTKVEAYNE